MLQGLPDFSQSVAGEHFIAFAPYEGIGNVAVIPLVLNIAKNPDGKPAFLLESVRTTNPFGALKPHGILDLRLVMGALEPAYVSRVREKWQRAPIVTPYFYQGFLRFYAKEGALQADTSDLQHAESLEGLSLSKIRLTRQISTESVTLLKKALQGDTLLLNACAELELKGVAPRVGATVEFDPAELIRAIEKLADPERRVTVSSLVKYLKEQLNSLPLSFRQKEVSFTPDAFAVTMSDWILARFATFTPAPEDLLEPHIKLFTSSEAGRGKFTWDLSQPLFTSRIFIFQFDALAEARELVRSKGINALFLETVLQPLNTGYLRLMITHELPKSPESIVSIGVKLNAPPTSQRSQAINKTVILPSTEQSVFAELRFSPAEKQQYTYTTFAVLRDSRGTKELLGVPTVASGGRLKLKIDDFPVELIEMEASSALLKVATVQGTYSWKEKEKEASTTVKLTTDKPKTTLGFAKNTIADAKCILEAWDKSSLGVVKAEFNSLDNLYVDLFAFAEYGPHTINISCIFGDSDKLFALELLPEGKEPIAKNLTLLSFTPKEPQRSWQWYADSIFQPGFRYRTYKTSNKPQDGWSAIQSPFLGTLEIDLAKVNIKPMPEVPKLDGDRDFEGVRYFQNPADEHSFYFIPLEPGPQMDGEGEPTLSLIIAGDMNMLQLETQWQADSEVIERLRKKIATENKELTPALIRMSFAPIQVEKVDLIMKNSEEEQILSTTQPSGFSSQSAIFNLTLTDEQKDKVIAALHEKKDTLQIRYYAARDRQEKIQLTIQGDIREAKRELNSTTASLEDCRVWIVNAIGAGKLKIMKSGDDKTGNKLWQQAEKEAMEITTTQVLRFVQTGKVQPDAAKFSVVVEQVYTTSIPFFTTTDVGTWFSGNKGDDHIQNF